MEALKIAPIEAEISLLSQLKLLNRTLPDKITTTTTTTTTKPFSPKQVGVG
jgi:hypothetical protein